MGYVEVLIVLSVIALHLPIVTERKGTDQLVTDAVFFQTFLKMSGFVPMGGEPVGELGSIVCLDVLDFARECLYQMVYKLGGRVILCSSKTYTKRHLEYPSMAVCWKNCFSMIWLFLNQEEGTNLRSTWIRCPG